MFQVPEIKLLPGHHSETGTTGQGCFMNVIAYLNGDAQITDESECVCVTVRPIAIWLNDYCDNKQRQRLLPFILRALGSATNDPDEVARRVKLAVKFANIQKDLAAENAKSAANYAANYAATYAEHVFEYATEAAESARSAEHAIESAEHAIESAEYAARSALYAAKSSRYAATYAESAAMKEKIIQAGFDFLNEALPPLTEANETIIERARTLASIAA